MPTEITMTHENHVHGLYAGSDFERELALWLAANGDAGPADQIDGLIDDFAEAFEEDALDQQVAINVALQGVFRRAAQLALN